jgi:two-component system response regulator PilR (NtrC family)
MGYYGLFFEIRTQREEEAMISVNQVLVISPEQEDHEKINAAMNRCGLSSICCRKFDEARVFMTTQKFGVVFCHDILPDGDFRVVVSAAKPTPVVVLSRFAEWDHYFAALRAGAFDYIACPPDSAETERIVWSAIASAHEFAAGAAH